MFIGLCRGRLLKSIFVGEGCPDDTKEVVFGMLSLSILCGPFGGRGMVELSFP